MQPVNFVTMKRKESKNTRVIVVDRDKSQQKLLSKCIRTWGHEVLLMGDAKRALEVIRDAHGPIILVLDWETQNAKGLDLSYLIRSELTDINPFIIMISGVSPDDKRQAFVSGADYFLSKPVNLTDLEIAIRVGDRNLKWFYGEFLDRLTGLWDRKQIEKRLTAELNRSERERTNLGVALIDLDHLKTINDLSEDHHSAGDDALTAVARRTESMIRDYDEAGRWGGDEFLVIFPGCTKKNLEIKANQIKKAVEKTPLRLRSGKKINISVSIGVAVSTPRKFHSASALIKLADSYLYRAKHKGRSRVEFAFSSHAAKKRKPD